MSVVIHETDFGTKGRAQLKLQELYKNNPKVFDQIVYKFWQKVYFYALKACPKDTGALAASIRLKRIGSIVDQTKVYKVAIKSNDNVASEWIITAGGEGIINPRHKKEVDYARAIHDGYRRGNKWIKGRPFLTQAFNKALKEMPFYLAEYGKWAEETWAEGGMKVPPNVFSTAVPVGFKKFKDGTSTTRGMWQWR